MTQIRYEKDTDLSLIRGKKVAIIGELCEPMKSLDKYMRACSEG